MEYETLSIYHFGEYKKLDVSGTQVDFDCNDLSNVYELVFWESTRSWLQNEDTVHALRVRLPLFSPSILDSQAEQPF